MGQSAAQQAIGAFIAQLIKEAPCLTVNCVGHLRRIMADRTTILIAQRISTLRHADHIIVLEDGRIAEAGTHAQLMRGDGFYADIARRQELAAELESL